MKTPTDELIEGLVLSKKMGTMTMVMATIEQVESALLDIERQRARAETAELKAVRAEEECARVKTQIMDNMRASESYDKRRNEELLMCARRQEPMDQELTALRARLLAVEAERDEARNLIDRFMESCGHGKCGNPWTHNDRIEILPAIHQSLNQWIAWYSTLRAERDALAERMKALEADKARLDLLEDVSKIYHIEIRSQPSAETVFNGQGKGLRAAIDAARQPDAQGPVST